VRQVTPPVSPEDHIPEPSNPPSVISNQAFAGERVAGFAKQSTTEKAPDWITKVFHYESSRLLQKARHLQKI
jgi:hypothetical protein